MSAAPARVSEPSKLISPEQVEEIVTACLLADCAPAYFADHYCDLEGLYSDDRMEVQATCFVAWLAKREEMGISPTLTFSS